MSTRNIVPRADGEGGLGTSAKNWNEVRAKEVYVNNVKVDVYSATQVIQTNPVFYARSGLLTPDKKQFDMPEITNVNIGGDGYILPGDTYYLNDVTIWDEAQYASAANRAGKDFYIYLVQPTPNNSTEPRLILSHSSTVPSGYTYNNSRKIGGFHCLCLSVGTISGHTLSGYETGDILPLSVWDLKHRPVSAPEGMVYVPGVGKWFDIYLASWDGSKLVSGYGLTTADGTSSKPFHGELFAGELGKVGKRLLLRDEFIVIAKGSNELTNIYGSADPNTTGGHVDTNNRRMISNYGIEDCCGGLWQWGHDCYEFYPGATWTDQTLQYINNGYQWKTESIYNATVDSQQYGSCGGLLRRVGLGGGWYLAAYCGSRAASCDNFSAYGSAGVGARGASEPRTPDV